MLNACCRTRRRIRHRGKIQAIISNARARLAMGSGGDLSPILSSHSLMAADTEGGRKLDEILPQHLPSTMRFNKGVKKRGFKFVGTTYLLLALCGRADWSTAILPYFCHPGEKHDSQIPGENVASILALWMKVPFMPILYRRRGVTGTRRSNCTRRPHILPAWQKRVWRKMDN